MGGLFQLFSGKGGDFQELDHRPLFAVLFSLVIEDNGLVKVYLSPILDSLGSNAFILSSGYVIPSKLVPCPLPSCFTVAQPMKAIAYLGEAEEIPCLSGQNFVLPCSPPRVYFLSKKIRDTKGILPEKIGTIKDRSDRDLTEAEDIKKRWQEYREELYKKSS